MSEDNVIRLFPAQESAVPDPGTPRPDIVEALQDMITMAERGEIDTLIAVASLTNAGFYNVISTPENAPFSLVGALDVMKDKIKERCNLTAPDKGGRRKDYE